MSHKWNLQDIRPPEPRKKRRVEPVERTAAPTPERRTAEVKQNGDLHLKQTTAGKKSRKPLALAAVIFLIIVGLGLVASLFMQGAKLTVFPRFKEPNINATFTAYKEPKAGELNYEIMTLNAEGERQVTATGKEEAHTKAEGTILIYNKHQKGSVRLVANTRFESPEGLIFKIKDAAVVPGYTKDANGEIVPGVVSADVYADQDGEKYNLAPTSFKIPGFRDYPEYDTVYAESVENMTGGFSGEKFIIDDNELKTAQDSLREELRNSLAERVDSEAPAGFIKFNDSITYTYESLPSTAAADNQATIKEKVVLKIPLFKDSSFAKYMANASVSGYEGAPVRIENVDALKFSYTSATTSKSDIAAADSIEFKLIGKPTIIWEYDADKLKTDLIDANKTALPSILGGYPAIERAEAVLSPFWKKKFPTAASKIDIVEVVGQDK